MEWPTISQSEVRHVGTMDASEKCRDSYEGSGLSVTQNPDAWRRASGVSGDEWLLSRYDGCFLDVLSLEPEHVDEITEWGLESGLLERCVAFFGIRKDGHFNVEAATRLMKSGFPDLDERINYILSDGYPALEAQNVDTVLHGLCLKVDDGKYVCSLSGTEHEFDSDEVVIEELSSLKASPALKERMLQDQEVVGELAIDQCLIAYCEDVLLLDGAFWNEDPAHQDTTPCRGVIHKSALDNWSVTRVPDPDYSGHDYQKFFAPFPLPA